MNPVKQKAALIIITISLAVYAETILTDDFLINNEFKTGSEVFGTGIVFSKNNKYEIEYDSGGVSWYNEGKYSIRDNKVYLSPEICKGNKEGPIIDCNQSINNGICSIVEDYDSLFYSKKLLCQSISNKDKMGFHEDGIDYDVESSKVKAGEKKRIRKARIFYEDGYRVKEEIEVDIPVIVMGEIEGTVKTNLKMRNRPSTDAHIIQFIKDEGYSPMKYIPKDTKIILLARTEEKVTVDKWSNYWYYVYAGFSGGWVFGEFVDIVK